MYAILLGLQLEGQPKEDVQYREWVRGSMDEIKKHGRAINAERVGEKNSLFNMPNEWIIEHALSIGENTKSFFVTGDNANIFHYVDGVLVSWTEYEEAQIKYERLGELHNHTFEEVKLSGFGLRMRIVEVQPQIKRSIPYGKNTAAPGHYENLKSE